jgi:HEPN domain-containing protein
MMKASELRQKARAQLTDAEVLLRSRRYDAAVYICGYAVEFALKARICRTLHWPEYLTVKGFESFKTHDLEVLLLLSGREGPVKSRAMPHWSTVKSWKPEMRYGPIGKVTRQDARDMISSTRALIGVLG